MHTNIDYLIESIRNNETLDERYMILDEDPRLDEIVLITQDIKEIITTIKVLNNNNENADRYYDKLLKLVSSELGSKNEFNCFINACDSTIGTITKHTDTFKTIVDLYLEHRVMSDTTSREWIQALIDRGSNRSLGTVGEQKVIDIAVEKGFIFAVDDNQFISNDFSISKYRKSLKDIISPDLKFGAQNKDLDIIIKAKDMFYYLEAKHIKDAGGAQDKQIKELIDLISINPQSDKIGIIAFFDGVYSNILLDISEPLISNPELLKIENQNKLITQKYEILVSLGNNKNSFWLNTAGLNKFLLDLLSE